MYDIQEIVKEARKINNDIGELIKRNWAQISNDLDFFSGFYDLLHALRAPRVREVEELIAKLFVQTIDAATRLGVDLQKIVEKEYPELKKKEAKVVRKKITPRKRSTKSSTSGSANAVYPTNPDSPSS